MFHKEKDGGRSQMLSAGVSRIYKQMQRLKKEYMGGLGMKGTHVMCLHYLNQYPGGRSRLSAITESTR